MKLETHLENLKESIQEIEDAVSKGVEAKQMTIGFHSSSGAMNILEIILHENNLIDPGFIVKHEWLNFKNIVKTKLNFDFPKKEGIIKLMMKVEFLRNPLCYGRRRTEEEIIPIIEAFNNLKKLFQEVTKYEL